MFEFEIKPAIHIYKKYNNLVISVDTLPFGGVGNSGMGRYRGKFGFDEFTHEKAVLKRGFFADGIAA